LRLDASAELVRGVHLLRGASCERDGQLLLGESVGELRRRGHLGLEGGAPVGRERPIGERRKLGDLAIVDLVVSTTSQRHANAQRNGACATSWAPAPG